MSETIFVGRIVADPEVEYLRLRLAGEEGWGGPSFARRREGWSKSIALLRQLETFPRPPARLLELGCGNGMVSRLFAEQGYQVHGIDMSAVAVSWATELFAEAGLSGHFRQGRVDCMPFYETATFDLVIDGNCFHCLLGRERTRCLAEIGRILRPGGAFVISTMCGEPKTDEIRRRFDPRTRQLLDQGRPFRTLKPAAEILAEIHAAQFHISHHVLGEGALWNHLVALCQPLA
jgi:SAM-dependent methyltransferase